MERDFFELKQDHPEIDQMLFALLHPTSFVMFDPEDGKEKIHRIHEHLAKCELCLTAVHEEIRSY